MATICYSCCSDLSSEPKDRIIIRNKNDEYSCLYSIVVDVLSNEKLEMQPEKLHQNRHFLFLFESKSKFFSNFIDFKDNVCSRHISTLQLFNLIISYFTLPLIAYLHSRHIPLLGTQKSTCVSNALAWGHTLLCTRPIKYVRYACSSCCLKLKLYL